MASANEREGEPYKRSIKINVDHVHKHIYSKKKNRNDEEKKTETVKERRNKLFAAVAAAAAEFKLIRLHVDNKPHYLFNNSLIPIN